VYGERESQEGTEYMVASESVALDSLGFELVDDIRPGEVIILPLEGKVERRICADQPKYSPCIFEQVYLARPDSMIDQISVYRTRLRMGERLAQKILREWPDHDIDVIIPIPDTSRTSALQMSHAMDVRYREGFIKNRYIGRTFIMPGQAERKKSVRQKLNAIDLEFRGKNVLLVDDSIVRGTTSKQIVQMARDRGARKVYFASAAPPVRYPNVYGIDMPAASELVANNRTEEEVCELIGADRLFYQDLEDLILAASEGNPEITEFDTSCFSKDYVTGDVSDAYLAGLESQRSDVAKTKKASKPSNLRDVSKF
jgi:amidophosphoribosyltransferase